MKYFVRIIDNNGFFVRDDFVDELTEFTIETPCPPGFYLPRWDGTQWVEGKTAEEIAALKAQSTTEPTQEERLAALEAAMLETILGGAV